jgi:hypothetical protein
MDDTGRKQSDAKKLPRGGGKVRENLLGSMPSAEVMDAPPESAAAAPDGSVKVWADDPLGGVEITRPTPVITGVPLECKINGAAVPPGHYQVGTANFRYWTAAAALRRCAEFWLARDSSLAWQHGSGPLQVILDGGLDLNAFYDRQRLVFFHGRVLGKKIYSGESPDIVCHEMGHAILDGFKPELWDVASQEVAAFHEAFGDMSAILAALQVPEIRNLVLEETNGRISRNSRVSRLAEQLGAAIRALHPDAVDNDSLRNAANRFLYQSPLELKSSGPASTLTSEPHSFSRVFTGAFLDALAGMLVVIAHDVDAPTEAELLQASEDMGDILLAGVRNASVVSNFYAQVAAGMVSASPHANTKYPRMMKSAFVRRDILSLQSATSVETLSAAAGMFSGAAAPQYESAYVAFDGAQFGLGERALLCETPSQPRRIAASAAGNDIGPVKAPGSETAALSFVEELFKRGRVDCDGVAPDATRFDPVIGLKTHRLEASNDAVVLRRVLCDCGLCQH